MSKVEENKKAEEQVQEEEPAASGCGILGKYPVLSVLGFALVGIALGVGLSFWEPDDMDDKDKTLKWIGLIGDLFIRALKCVVLPLVFVNVIISVVEMMTVGKAGSIGWKTIGLYLLTTVIASIIGIISTLAFKPLYNEGEFTQAGPAMVQLGCNAEDSYITEGADGTLTCMSGAEMDDTKFIISDLSGAFVKSSSGARNDISLSDTVYDGVFTKLVTDNITVAFFSANFAAIVVFACAFGVALSKVLSRMEQEASGSSSIILGFLREMDKVLLIIINWIISITPFAVFSLIVKAVGSQENLKDAFANVGYLVVATIVAMVAHYFITYVAMYTLITKSNAFHYLRFAVPAQTMAFACASSAATLPMTLKSVESSGKVPDPIARFVCPLGATVNMDGGAIYFPCACIWLAVLNGIDIDISAYFLLVIIATIGSAGTAPVPSASLVLIITAYNTVFNTSGTPDGFSFILAIDWFMDRLRTTLNVSGDFVVAGLVAHVCPLDETDKMLGAGAVSSSDEDSEEA